MTFYTEIAVKINPVCADIVCNILQENFNCEGIITGVEEYKKTKLTKAVYDVVKAYVTDENLNADDVRSFFHQQRQFIAEKQIFSEDIGSWDIQLTPQPQEDWSKKWKEHWKPSLISENTVICPSWEKYEPQKDEKVIILDPGNAFGTGTHATTRLCAAAIEKFVKDGDIVADVGCGSGILSICAVKHGAKFVDAVDNDITAVETSIENAKMNNVSDKIKFTEGTIDILEDKKYDFVASNILHNVLRDIMPDIKRIMKINAKCVLSGILEEKQSVVTDALKENNMKILKIKQDGEWVAILGERED